jgi:outer membrane protein TolC
MTAKGTVACLVVVAAISSAIGQTPPSTPQPVAPYRLTLSEAIHKGLQANLNVLLADSRVDQAEGTRQRRLAAALLPRVSGQTYANLHNLNLQAFGLSYPGAPVLLGPLSNYDFRLYGQQNVVDLTSYRTFKASEQALSSAKLDDKDARDLIVRAVAAWYLDAESAAARTDAAQSRVNDAGALFKLAKDKHDAGTATGVDVLRAQVQLANERQSLLIAQNQYKQALLELAREIGMSPAAPIELAESLEFHPFAEQSPETLVNAALVERADYLSLASQRQALVEQQRANRARLYPKVSINGNYGGIGRSIGSVEGTGTIQGQIDFTIYDRDRNGEALELAGQIKAIDSRIDDLRRGIDQDVRSALLNLDSARRQVDVAQQGQDLARRELEMTKDRFQQGTANNVEVVTAQDEVARAEENFILAVSSYVDGEFALARAQGDTEKNIARLSTQ